MKFAGKTDIFFDWDHTIWDFEYNSDMAFSEILNTFFQVDVNIFLKTYRPINTECWEQYSKGRMSKAELRFVRLGKTLDKLNISYKEETICEMADTYLENLATHNKLFDGAVEVLDYLSKDYKLHIISNGFKEVQYKKINNSGVSKYFESITLSEEVGYKKPDSKIFEFAIDKARTNANNSLMIGDNWEADIEGAVNAGMDAIYFNSISGVKNNIPTVSHLMEIQKYL